MSVYIYSMLSVCMYVIFIVDVYKSTFFKRSKWH